MHIPRREAFNLLNQGNRHTGIATSDSHASAGEEPGSPRTFVYFGGDDPSGVDPSAFVDAVKRNHAATLCHGPFLTMTVGEAGTPAAPATIGAEMAAPSGMVTVKYKLSAPPWVSVGRLHVWVNGRLAQRIDVDPSRNLAMNAPAGGGPLSGEIPLKLTQDSWIVLEAVGVVWKLRADGLRGKL